MAGVTLTCPDAPSDTGAYRLSWTELEAESVEPATFRLLEDGEVLYEGPQSASTVTGRPEGDYTYELGVVAADSTVEWVDSCDVAVRPPDLQLAFLLFGLGFVVFVATTIVVIRGHRAHRRGEL